MFTITGSAHQVLLRTIENERQAPEEILFLRLSMGIGWGGPKLKLSLEEQTITGDLTFPFDELTILIHENDYVYFDHTKLDYVQDVLGKYQFKLLKI